MAFKKKGKKSEEKVEQKPLIFETESEYQEVKKNKAFTVSQIIVSVVLGFFSGFIVWGAFVGSMVLTDLLWVEGVGEWQAALAKTPLGGWWLPLVFTTLGGLIIGLWTKYTQAMPIPMEEVMAHVKKTGKFGFKRPFATVIGFLLPLVFGGAIGPEAGMTGLTAHACTAIGGALRRRGINLKGLSDVSISAAMAGMFGNPLVGLAASAEGAMPDDDLKNNKGSFDPYTYNIRRSAKLVLYTLSALASVLGAYTFTTITGASFGFPRFDGIVPAFHDLWIIIACCIIGYIGAFLYQASKYGFTKLGKKMDDRPVSRALLCGIILGIMALFCPMVMFPGEEQLFVLQEEWQTWTVLLLFATGLLKCIAAPMCLNMGWNGGGIFPLIYSGAALGYGLSMISGVDPMFCVALTSGVLIAGTQRKIPISIAFLFLAFPTSTVIFCLLAVIIGVIAPMPKAFFPEKQPSNSKILKKFKKDDEELQ